MVLKKLILATLLFSFSSTVCFAQTYIGKQKDIDQILKNIAQFSQDFMDGNAKGVAKSYTADGKIMPNKSDIIEGTTALEKFWTRAKDQKVIHHKVTPSEIRIVKKTAYDYGYYEGTTQYADGSESSWKGKYVIVWKKVGKDWKIYLDCWNSL